MTDLAEAARATRTRDELLEKVSAAIDETLYAYSHGEMSDDMAKESILALIPPRPKLEWRGTGLSGDFEELCLGGLVVGFIFMRGDGNGFLGQVGARVEMGVAFRTREKARAAVESAVRKELGLRVRSPGRAPQSMRSDK